MAAPIFERDAAVSSAGILRLHLIDFLSAICGIAVFCSTRSIAVKIRTGAESNFFFMVIAPPGRSPQIKLGHLGQVRASSLQENRQRGHA